MQIAAQMKMTPATARKCRGHHGTHFVAVPTGGGHWVYYWLSLSQTWFWRSRSAGEMAEIVRRGESECFVCGLQRALEREALFEDGD